MRHKYFYHIFFWLLAFALCAFLLSYDNNWSEALLLASIYLPITIASAYLISNYLIPKYLLRGKKRKFILYVVYLIIAAVYTTILINTLVLIMIADYQNKRDLNLFKKLNRINSVIYKTDFKSDIDTLNLPYVYYLENDFIQKSVYFPKKTNMNEFREYLQSTHKHYK
jgi:hypothetical protein